MFLCCSPSLPGAHLKTTHATVPPKPTWCVHVTLLSTFQCLMQRNSISRWRLQKEILPPIVRRWSINIAFHCLGPRLRNKVTTMIFSVVPLHFFSHYLAFLMCFVRLTCNLFFFTSINWSGRTTVTPGCLQNTHLQHANAWLSIQQDISGQYTADHPSPC